MNKKEWFEAWVAIRKSDMGKYRYRTGDWVRFTGYDSLHKEDKGEHLGMIVTYSESNHYPAYTVVELVDNEYGNEYWYGVREEDISDAFRTDVVQGIKFMLDEHRPHANIYITRDLAMADFAHNVAPTHTTINNSKQVGKEK